MARRVHKLGAGTGVAHHGPSDPVPMMPQWLVPPPGSLVAQPVSDPVGTQGLPPDDGAPGGEVLLALLGALSLGAAAVLAAHGHVLIALLLLLTGGFLLHFANVIRLRRRAI
ncbi:hypothetical protein ABZ319_32975 [Nocardia sp. NPDC005978]|uniref:hypothetical protein n=1 Tax=Nocardia sp. NPDC005978 TaxID=3156725 RepID=UPI0033BC5D13